MKTKFIVKRIKRMENIMDEVIYYFKSSDDFFTNRQITEKVSILSDYLSSGDWLSDFEKHERGELPKKLKCGVLSEDTLYNLLCDIDEKRRNSF